MPAVRYQRSGAQARFRDSFERPRYVVPGHTHLLNLHRALLGTEHAGKCLCTHTHTHTHTHAHTRARAHCSCGALSTKCCTVLVVIDSVPAQLLLWSLLQVMRSFYHMMFRGGGTLRLVPRLRDGTNILAHALQLHYRYTVSASAFTTCRHWLAHIRAHGLTHQGKAWLGIWVQCKQALAAIIECILMHAGILVSQPGSRHA